MSEKITEPVQIVTTDPVWVTRGGVYLLDEHAGVMIDSAGNFSAKTRGNPRALAVLLKSIAEDIIDSLAATDHPDGGQAPGRIGWDCGRCGNDPEDCYCSDTDHPDGGQA